MMPRHAITIASFAIFASTSLPTAAADIYRLSPGDHVQLMVSDFRTETGEAQLWPVFSTGTANFVVGPDGRLSLPVLGQLDAAGKTITEIEDLIAAKLQAKVDLTSRPDVSIQIVKFRPFYVVGGVDKPGEYEYRPGLTVLQALALAGGVERVASDAMIGLEKDAINSRGDLRALTADLGSYTAHQARLDAEINEKPQIEFPAELLAKAHDPDAARAMREEQLLFDSRRGGLAAQAGALEQNKQYLRGAIEQMGQKEATIARQLAAMRKELDLIVGLVSKGLTGAPRQLELEQNIGQIENNQLDVQAAIVRNNEDISKSDRDILDLRTKFRDAALREAEDVRVKLAETIKKIQTAQALIVEAEVRAPGILQANSSSYANPIYELVRRSEDGKSEELPAEEGDLVQPGDVVRVFPGAAAASSRPAN